MVRVGALDLAPLLTAPTPTMPTHRHAMNAVAHLRHLARLDTNGPELIGSVLELLHTLIGFDSSGYFYTGSDGDLGVHMEHADVLAAVPDHFDPRILRSERAVFHNVLQNASDITRHRLGPQTLTQMLTVPYGGLLRSDYYNVVMRPAGVGDWLSLALRTVEGRGVGILFLFRPPGAAPFRPDEVAMLARLEPSLARVLQPCDLEAGDSEACGQGVLAVSSIGSLLWTSEQADVLLAKAFGWRWRQDHARYGPLPLPLQLLMQRLQWRAPDATRHSGVLWPQMEVRNAHGRFVLQAIPLNSAEGAGQAVAIHITQRVARSALLLADLRAKGLPQRQRELAYWLAHGLPESQIAARMGISVNTVVYHRRQLYARMGVVSRADLMAQLRIP